MTKKDEAIIKEVLRSKAAQGKTVYVDSTSVPLKGAVLFLPRARFPQMEDRQRAIDDRFDAIVREYESKETPFHQRFADELRFNEAKYKEDLGKEFDYLKRRTVVSEIPDEEGVIAFFYDTKPKRNYEKALVFVRQRKNGPKVGEGFPYKIYEMRDGFAWMCNAEFTLGEPITSEVKADSAPLPYPMLRMDYQPSRSDKVRLCLLTQEQTTRFRQLKTHKFVGNAPSKSVGVLINGELAGVIGYNQAFTVFYGAFEDNELFLQFSIACTPYDRNVRMGKLIDRISLWDQCARIVLNDYERTQYTDVVSTSITPYPECKHARRLMTLRNKTYDEKSGMYKLVYGCEMTHEKTLKQVFNEWMDELEHARKQREKQNQGRKD